MATALSNLAESLITPYLSAVPYPSKEKEKKESKKNYFYEVKHYINANKEAKGVPYVRETPKSPSRRDIRRGNI